MIHAGRGTLSGKGYTYSLWVTVEVVCVQNGIHTPCGEGYFEGRGTPCVEGYFMKVRGTPCREGYFMKGGVSQVGKGTL